MSNTTGIIDKLNILSKEEILKLHINLIENLEQVSKTYQKMYDDRIKTIDTYSYVCIFRGIIDKTNRNLTRISNKKK